MKTSRIKKPTAMAYRKRVCKAMNYISRNRERDLSLEEIAGVDPNAMRFKRVGCFDVGVRCGGEAMWPWRCGSSIQPSGL